MHKMAAHMRIFALKSCDTCSKALSRIRAAGHDPQVIDIRSDGIGPDDLTQILTRFGGAAINRASTTWRGLSEAEKLLDPAALLMLYPTLLKRPVIDNDGQWSQGWTAEVQSNLLKS